MAILSQSTEDTDSDNTSLRAICLLRRRSELLGDVAGIEAELLSRGIPFSPAIISSSSGD